MNAGLLAFVPPAHWQVPDASNKIYEQYHITVPIRGGPYAEPTMRISPHIWNGEDDMDRLADALGRP
jgi:selenocysteine lyase/cysteine desulfurase